MMNKRRATRSMIMMLAVVGLVGVCAGCRSQTSCVELVSYMDPLAPERYVVELADCVYRVDHGGRIQAVGRAVDSSGDEATRQYVLAEVYWRPLPGKTNVDSSTADMLLRYVIATDTGVAVYSGTGFTLPRKKRGDRLAIEIESGRLQLETLSGDMPDMLGAAHLTGSFVADQDGVAAAQLIREMQLQSGR